MSAEKSNDLKVASLEEAPEKATIDQTISQAVLSDEQQKILRRKFDKRVLPIVCLLYLFSYLDRSNIGNAKTAGAQKDLGLSSSQWAWVLNSLYIAYELFEWTTLFWKIFPAHIYVSILCIGWGTAGLCSGVVTNMAGLCVCRAFLGMFEVMLATGSPFYLSMFYQRKELGIRMALLLGTAPLAACFASALAYGIEQIGGSWAPWRWLFVIEGAPTLLATPIVFFLLPDSPATAKFLTEDERTMAVERIQERDTIAKSSVNWTHYLKGLMDWKAWVHAFIQFCWNYSFASLSNFLPTIIKNLGYTSVKAQGLSAPPYLGAFLCCVAAAFVSDRWGKRGPIIAFFGAVALVGYLILTIVGNSVSTGARYAGVWFAACGTFPIVALNLTWVLNNSGNDSKKGSSVAIVALVGQLTSFIGSSVFPDKDAPDYKLGSGLGCGFCGMIVFLALGMHFALEKENKRRDREYGKPYEHERLDISALGDDHPKYRYLT